MCVVSSCCDSAKSGCCFRLHAFVLLATAVLCTADVAALHFIAHHSVVVII